jgi:hypothetical protein
MPYMCMGLCTGIMPRHFSMILGWASERRNMNGSFPFGLVHWQEKSIALICLIQSSHFLSALVTLTFSFCHGARKECCTDNDIAMNCL